MITPEEFKEARQNAGLSQEEAGKLLDMSQTALWKNEDGQVKRINKGGYRLLLIWSELTEDQKARLLSV